MRILKLHHPTGHPYWQEGEFKVQFPDGRFYHDDTPSFFGFKIEVRSDGIYKELYACGSGYGKRKLENKAPILIIRKSEYDKIEYVGEPLVMSEALKEDLRENQISL